MTTNKTSPARSATTAAGARRHAIHADRRRSTSLAASRPLPRRSRSMPSARTCHIDRRLRHHRARSCCNRPIYHAAAIALAPLQTASARTHATGPIKLTTSQIDTSPWKLVRFSQNIYFKLSTHFDDAIRTFGKVGSQIATSGSVLNDPEEDAIWDAQLMHMECASRIEPNGEKTLA